MSDSLIDEALFSSSIFKDETTLYHGYVPPKLPFREKEITTVAQNFRPLFLMDGDVDLGGTGISANIGVVGSAGVGKTASVRYTIRRLLDTAKAEKLNLVADYRNCLVNRTGSAIFRGLLCDKFGVGIRGFSNEEAVDILIRRLTSEKAYLILVLDEVSALPFTDIESFLHLTDEFGAHHRFFIILISRPTEWNTMLFPEIGQRISDVVTFDPYSAAEVKKILEYRAELAMKPTAYTEDLLDMITEVTTTTQNLRHGLEILHRAGRIADRKGITEIEPEMIREARASVYPELRQEILLDLKRHDLYILLGIARFLFSKSVTAVSVSEVQSQYSLVLEEYGERKRSSGDFLASIETLESLGIIRSLDSRRRSSGRSNRARITINDVPAAVLSERISEQLGKVKNDDES